MSRMDDDIRDWGERKQPPPTDKDALRKSIMDNLDKPAEAPAPKTFPAWQLAGAAALIAIGIFIGAMIAQPKPGPHTIVKAPGLSKEDLKELRTIADEIDKMFPEGLQWISKINGQVAFKPEAEKRISISGDSRLLIAYRVVCRDEKGRWQSISRQDIITWANEPVEMTEQKASLWCHVTDDRLAAVSMEMTLQANGVSLTLPSNTIQELGKSIVVTEKEHDGKVYQVIQTIHKI